VENNLRAHEDQGAFSKRRMSSDLGFHDLM